MSYPNATKWECLLIIFRKKNYDFYSTTMKTAYKKGGFKMKPPVVQLNLAVLAEVFDCANHLRSITVLVIVPRNNLNLEETVGNLCYHCLCGIEE